MAWIIRFGHDAKAPQHKIEGSLQSAELAVAEIYRICQTQTDRFVEHVERHCLITRFAPHKYDDIIIELGGHLQNTDLDEHEKHTIILPSNSVFTKFMVKREHRGKLHAGMRETLTQLRCTFWILRARHVGKKVIMKCLTCERFSSKPFNESFAPLRKKPSSRISAFWVLWRGHCGAFILLLTWQRW